MNTRALAMILSGAASISAAPSETWEDTMRRGLRSQRAGLYQEAEGALQQALHTASSPIEKATTLNDLGSIYQDQGNCSDAIEVLRKALHLWQNEHGWTRNANRTAASLQSVLLECGHLAEAEYIDRKFLGPSAGADDPLVLAGITSNRGSMAFLHKKFQKAEDLDRQAVGLFEQQFGAQDTRTGVAIGNLALTLAKTGKLEEALFQGKRALKAFEESPQPIPVLVVKTLVNLGSISFWLGRLTDADSYYRQAVAKTIGPESLSDTLTASVFESFSIVLAARKDGGQAKEMRRQAKALRAKAAVDGATHTVDILELSVRAR